MKKETKHSSLSQRVIDLSLLSLYLTGCNVTFNENYAVAGILTLITYFLTGPMLPPEDNPDKNHPFDRLK